MCEDVEGVAGDGVDDGKSMDPCTYQGLHSFMEARVGRYVCKRLVTIREHLPPRADLVFLQFTHAILGRNGGTVRLSRYLHRQTWSRELGSHHRQWVPYVQWCGV